MYVYEVEWRTGQPYSYDKASLGIYLNKWDAEAHLSYENSLAPYDEDFPDIFRINEIKIKEKYE